MLTHYELLNRKQLPYQFEAHEVSELKRLLLHEYLGGGGGTPRRRGGKITTKIQ